MEDIGADTNDPGPCFAEGPSLVYDTVSDSGYFDMFNNIFINDNSFS